MNEELRFTTDAGLIDRLGRELVGRQETALIELVKNSFDADARKVTVTLDQNALVIEDDGTGMTRTELVDGFLRLASTLKVKSPRSRIYGRQRAGRKGLGRFSTQRLGEMLRLSTWVDEETTGLELVINWRLFESGRDLNDVAVSLGPLPPATPGTTIRIEHLRDEWSNAQIKRSWRGLLALQQPFPVAPVARRPLIDPGFKVGFIRNGGPFVDPFLVADFQSEIFDHCHAVIEFRVSEDGLSEWRLTQSVFGPDRGWSRIHHEARDDLNPPTYRLLRKIAMKAHYFILSPELLPALVYSRIRDILRDEGGIRLYRNGFRVVPYGEPGNDWLRLDQLYGQRGTVLGPVSNKNFFGVIEVDDPEGKQFEEHTSREGLIETDAFSELTGLAHVVLATAVNRIAEDRGRKKSAGGSTQQKNSDNLERLRNAVRSMQATDDAIRRRRDHDGKISRSEIDYETSAESEVEPAFIEEAESTAKLIQSSIILLEQQQAELADEAALLRLLATLGLTTSEFSHETGMTFEAVRMDFGAVFSAALEAKAGDVNFAEQAERAHAMLSRLDALTAYLNELASARSIRQLWPISVNKAVADFQIGVRKLAEKASINLEIVLPDYDPLYTVPMHAAEIASVLLNLFSNSLKALRRSEGQRRILVEAVHEDESQIVIRFSDTGDGILIENREKVFGLFYTTRVAAPATASTAEQYSGTGLGLWIVYQIITKAGGKVEVVDAQAGYATCFELRLPAEKEN